MGGGKGGSTTSKVEIPAWLEDAAKQNLARADQLSTTGYTPYYGPDVAALMPSQEAAMSNLNRGASAFGMGAAQASGLPTAQDFGGGVRGYGSGGLYDQALAELAARMPGQYAALKAPFIDPITGALPASPFGSASAYVPTPVVAPAAAYQSSGGGGGSDWFAPTPASTGGYTSFRDMFDGGGPGASGSTFSGGLFSNTLNSLGVKPRS